MNLPILADLKYPKDKTSHTWVKDSGFNKESQETNTAGNLWNVDLWNKQPTLKS